MGEEMKDKNKKTTKWEAFFGEPPPPMSLELVISFEVCCLEKVLDEEIQKIEKQQRTDVSIQTMQEYSQYKTVIQAWRINKNSPYPDLDPAILNLPRIGDALKSNSFLRTTLFSKLSPQQPTEKQEDLPRQSDTEDGEMLITNKKIQAFFEPACINTVIRSWAKKAGIKTQKNDKGENVMMLMDAIALKTTHSRYYDGKKKKSKK